MRNVEQWAMHLPVHAFRDSLDHRLAVDQNALVIQSAPTIWHVFDRNVKILVRTLAVKMPSVGLSTTLHCAYAYLVTLVIHSHNVFSASKTIPSNDLNSPVLPVPVEQMQYAENKTVPVRVLAYRNTSETLTKVVVRNAY